MRIIAGRFRGSHLSAVGKGDENAHLRPTSDRVRESLFSMLTHMDVLQDARVLDLFAGTGALGLEALSRGASAVVFVENGKTAQRLVSQNIQKLRVAEETHLLRKDAMTLGRWDDAPFDLIFLDPPYGKGMGQRALVAASAKGWLAAGALVVWEENAPMEAPAGFERMDQRNYGDTCVTFLRFSGNAA